MLILILIDIQYLQKPAFSFEKGSNRQNHSSSGSLQKISPSKISNYPFPPLEEIYHPTLYRYLENSALLVAN